MSLRYFACLKVFLKRRPKTPWTKMKTAVDLTLMKASPRFRSVVEFPLPYLIVIMKSITHLFFKRCFQVSLYGKARAS